MHFVWGVDAASSVGCGTAPLAMLVVIAVFVRLVGSVDTRLPIARRPAMSAFGSHYAFSFRMQLFYHIST